MLHGDRADLSSWTGRTPGMGPHRSGKSKFPKIMPLLGGGKKILNEAGSWLARPEKGSIS